MTYDELLDTVYNILENDKIKKDNLLLTYELDILKYNELEQIISKNMDYPTGKHDVSDEFVVMIENIIIKFKQKK